MNMTQTESQRMGDSQLIEGLRNGDEQCYVELVKRNTGKLINIARKFVGEDEARDAVQETYIQAYSAIDQFRENSNISTWLYRILVNCCLTKLRKSKSKMEVSLDEYMPSFYEDGHRIHSSTNWPEKSAELRDLQRQVAVYIARLPDKYRMVLILRDMKGMTGAEVACILGISSNVTKVRLHRARQALREVIDLNLGDML